MKRLFLSFLILSLLLLSGCSISSYREMYDELSDKITDLEYRLDKADSALSSVEDQLTSMYSFFEEGTDYGDAKKAYKELRNIIYEYYYK